MPREDAEVPRGPVDQQSPEVRVKSHRGGFIGRAKGSRVQASPAETTCQAEVLELSRYSSVFYFN